MKKPKKSGLDPELAKLVGNIKHIARDALVAYTPIVKEIISTKSHDTKRIEHTLDGLLDFCFDARALKLYNNLCDYYAPINPEAAASYISAYHEMYGPEQGKRV